MRRLAITALALTAVVVGLPAAAPAAPAPPVVRTLDGEVRGRTVNGTELFQGIPYAAPPVGELRWRSPRPPRPWTGRRDATRPGPRCLQPDQSTGEPVGDEDCLSLNVQRPAGRSGRLPVMVFVHGGGFTDGAGSSYDSTRLTSQGGVVVVTVNYRLGALGFLAHPAVGDRAEGNFGLADQQAALRWVRRNIGRFGGDSRNVTLWGQSSGAASTCAQIASPDGRRLFDKAIVQSAPCGAAFLTRHQARGKGRVFADAVGCTGRDTGDCLRAASGAALVAASPRPTGLPTKAGDRVWGAVAGTPVLPTQPLTAIRRGAADHLPLLQGGTREEMRGFVAGRYDYQGTPLTAEQYPGVVRDIYGADAPAVLRRYPADAYPTPGAALATILTDEGAFIGACTQLTANDAVRTRSVFAYEFAESSGVMAGEFPLAAYHGTDTRFLLDSWDEGPWAPAPLTPEEAPLGADMVRAWATFARTGRPDADWPAYRNGIATSLTIDRTGPVDVAREHRCSFWRSVRRT